MVKYHCLLKNIMDDVICIDKYDKNIAYAFNSLSNQDL
jgi:hypothetical protein